MNVDGGYIRPTLERLLTDDVELTRYEQVATRHFGGAACGQGTDGILLRRCGARCSAEQTASVGIGVII